MPLRAVTNDAVLRFEPAEGGRSALVAADLNGELFAATWLKAAEAAQRAG